MTEVSHKEWLQNEYDQWLKALSECTVHNFKQHPVVKRMLGEIDRSVFDKVCLTLTVDQLITMRTIDEIGFPTPRVHQIMGNCFRFIYYAQQILKLNPSSICEIGGGAGQFYATLRALGWEGSYWIEDLGAARKFQYNYLCEVWRQTGLNTTQDIGAKEMIVSFYALGEFDDETKESYRQLITDTQHGYIAWNPHSGANDDLSIFSSHDIKVTPGVEPGISIIEW